jgi:hypothetical protein
MFGTVQHWIVGDDVPIDRHLAGLFHFFVHSAIQLFRRSIQKAVKKVLVRRLAHHRLDDVLEKKSFSKNSILLFYFLYIFHERAKELVDKKFPGY